MCLICDLEKMVAFSQIVENAKMEYVAACVAERHRRSGDTEAYEASITLLSRRYNEDGDLSAEEFKARVLAASQHVNVAVVVVEDGIATLGAVCISEPNGWISSPLSKEGSSMFLKHPGIAVLLKGIPGDPRMRVDPANVVASELSKYAH